jgi:site-specific DNA-methyltransferase (adenine-specific)
MAEPFVEIIEGDCRLVLAEHPAATFDCCIADPPYGDTSLAWDKRAVGWVSAVGRALKPNGSLWVFGSFRYLSGMVAEIEAAGFKYSQDIVWAKQNGTGFHNDRFRRVHEHAVMFYRGPWKNVYKDPQTTPDATAKTVRRKTRPTHTGHIEMGHYISEDGGPRLMRSVLEVANTHGYAVHPTQKPEGIIEPLVLYSTPPDGTVLDPFFGAGTTGVVCQKTGRSCVGIELDPDYYDAAAKRLGFKEQAAA